MPLTRAQEEFDKIAEIGRAEGLTLNQTNTHHTNTFNSHRLMKLGLSTGDKKLAERLNELLFEAFFVKNLNVAEHAVLLEAGKQAGLREEEIQAVLASDRSAAEVRADEKKPRNSAFMAFPILYLKMEPQYQALPR